MPKQDKKTVQVIISDLPEESTPTTPQQPEASSPLMAKVIAGLRTVYDPELPVNVYDLGLIYHIDTTTEGSVTVQMTLTAPNCPMADQIVQDVHDKLLETDGVHSAKVQLVWEPKWHKDMMHEAAKLELGLF